MQKRLVRLYKSSYGSRWHMLKNNINLTNEPMVTLQDYLLLKNLVPGTTLSLDFMGHQYIPLIKQLTIVEWPLEQPSELYNNIVLFNNRFLKYKTFNEMKLFLTNVSKFLAPGGRIFVGFNFQFVKYNRLKLDFLQEIDSWINHLESAGLKLVRKVVANIPKTDPYGDCLFVFELDTLNLVK